MENTRDYRHIDLVESEAKADKLTKQPSYRAHHIFHDNLIAVERYQTSVKMDKPIYTGMYGGRSENLDFGQTSFVNGP